MPKLTDDPFYDKIDLDYMLKGDGHGYIYTSDIMRFFECGYKKAEELRPKIENLVKGIKCPK